MIPTDLTEAAALCEAATPGPWIAVPNLGMIETATAKIIWPRNAIAPDDANHPLAVAMRIGACGSHAELNAENNLRFIAAARTLVPALLAEVQRLTGENAELKSMRASVSSALGDWDWDGLLKDAKRGEFDSAADAFRTIARLNKLFEVRR